MSLRAINLNLIPILRALLAEASVTRAAAALGLSQPATSNALNRLRVLLGDPILTSSGRTMHLTARAKRLKPVVDSICESIEAALMGVEFTPAAADREFVIATPDYMAALLGPSLLQRFMESAPGVLVRFVDVASDLHRALSTGDVDVAIIATDEAGLRGLKIEAGYVDRLVAVVAVDHPLATAGARTSADFHAYPRIALDLRTQGLRSPSSVSEMSAGDRPQLTASHLRILPLLVAQTSGVAIMPRALARQAAQMLPVTHFDLPAPPPPVDICLAWSPSADSDPAHRWLREQLDAAMRLHFDKAVPEAFDPGAKLSRTENDRKQSTVDVSARPY